MGQFSRRKLLTLLTTLPLLVPMRSFALTGKDGSHVLQYPKTVTVLKQAFRAEMIAHTHYLGYVEKALQEKYANIAYMFYAFSFSEKIHADNYQRLITVLGDEIAEILTPITIRETKANLIKSAEKELEKIEKTYPDFLQRLATEDHEEAIINCMYSWKSHRQHEKKVREIQRYSGMFFGSVARKIENFNLDFHVCNICGSTIDKKPNAPCDICNRPLSHYFPIEPPA